MGLVDLLSPLTELVTVSAPDTWHAPDNWTGPVPYLYYSFNSDASLILSNGSEITSDGKVCTCYICLHLLSNWNCAIKLYVQK